MITVKPETLESWSKAQKTKTLA